MGTKWNPNQHDAIYARDANILVSAGAGSGKTAVLVQRIIELICDEQKPVDINRLLVVTFTKKAAAEMKDRVTNELLSKIRNEPGNHNYRRQFALLSQARISTIHSFCLEVIRNNFGMADLEPDFKIIDENLNTLLWSRAGQNTKEDILGDDLYVSLLEYYGFSKNGEAIDSLISSMHKVCVSQPYPELWIKQAYDNFLCDDINDMEFINIIKENVIIILRGIKDELIDIGELIDRNESLYIYHSVFNNAIEDIDKILCAHDSFESLRGALFEFSFDRLPSNKDPVDPEAVEYVKAVKTELSGRMRKLYKDYFSIGIDQIKLQNTEFANIFESIVNLYDRFVYHYQKLKSEYNTIDYNDMERICLGILTEKKDGRVVQSFAAREIMDSIDEIFIDEYQDSNLVQEKILFSVSKCEEGKNNVFMVGDVKQSIYRFRLAMPELFISKYIEYKTDYGADKRKISMQENYRSRKQIIDFINEMFSNLMTKNAGEIDYVDDQKLLHAADYPEVEDDDFIDILLYDKKEELDDEYDELENAHKEALLIKDKIIELVGSKKISDTDNKLRYIEYKDIVILARSVRGFAPCVRDILLSFGIPVYAEGEEGYFDQLEIRIALSMLNIIDNSYQDIDMAAIMRSYIGGYTLDEIARIRLLDKKEYLYSNLEKVAASDKKSQRLLDLIKRFKKEKYAFRLHEFINKLFDELYFWEYCRALPVGELRIANIRLLLSRAKEYEESIGGSLFTFLNYISDMSSKKISPEIAKTIAENENVVRIMSVHSSKGLQFPCVILANTGKRFNRTDERGILLTHKTIGAGPEIVKRDRKLRYDSIIKKAIVIKTMLENISEEMRILYVALTRAKERLYITGGMAGAEEYIKKISIRQNLNEYKVIHARSFLDWILLSIREKSRARLISIADIAGSQSAEEIEHADLFSSDVLNKEMADKINWEYPYLETSKYPAKITVTELKKFKYDLLSRDYEEEENDYLDFDFDALKPEFVHQTKRLDPKERGTVYHYVMQLIDFDQTQSLLQVKKQLEGFFDRGFLSEREYNSIDSRYIYSFFESEIGRKCKLAPKLYKETPFNTVIDITGQTADAPVLQGVIDLFFEYEQGLILIDYKTDYVKTGEENILIKRYSKQLEYYEYALEQLTGRPVIEKYIYSFYLAKEIGIKD